LRIEIMERKIVAIACLLMLLWAGTASSVSGAEIDVPARVKELKAKSPASRARAAVILARSAKNEASTALLSAVKAEQTPSVRAQMVNSLGNMKRKDAASDIIRLAKEDPSKEVRTASCLALGTIKDPSAIAMLREIALKEGEDENIRISAASSLTFFLEDTEAGKTLENLLKSDNRVIRFGVVNTLRHVRGTPQGKSLLNIAVKDTEPDILNLAAELLKG
jgi:HEAT repeat protein